MNATTDEMMSTAPAPASAETAAAEDSVASDFVAQVAQDMKDDRLELPGFPEAVLRVQRALSSPDSSADDVVQVLSCEPALAAEALQIANSVELRRADREIADLRTAVNRMGFNLMHSIAVAFAIRQLRQRKKYSAAARVEIESIWRDSVELASRCSVLARHCTRVNPDEALLAGLLHALGRLYIVMRAEGIGGDVIGASALEAASGWHAAVGRAILETWGLPEALQYAVEHQDDAHYEGEHVSVTDVLIAAKFLRAGAPEDDPGCPALERLAAVRGMQPRNVLDEHADEVRALRRSLGG